MEDIKIFDMSSEELYEMIDKVRVTLLKDNSEYKKLKHEVLDIVTECPNLEEIYDTTVTLELTKEECKMLQKMLILKRKISDFEEHEILFLGGKIAYIYFRKIGLIKE